MFVGWPLVVLLVPGVAANLPNHRALAEFVLRLALAARSTIVARNLPQEVSGIVKRPIRVGCAFIGKSHLEVTSSRLLTRPSYHI